MAIDDDSVTPGELPAIAEEALWVDHLPALVTGVKVRGGTDGKGAANFQARVLDARTRYLYEVIQGLATGGIILVGELRDEDELNAIPTVGLKVGTAYFVEFSLRVWNGTEWASSGSLRGKNGLNLLGTWPDNLDLPEITENEIGDAYIWQHDIHVLVPSEETQKWEALGIRGPAGESNYDIWKRQPGNENKTEAEFIEAQRGLKGNPGDDAFATWKKIPGNENKTIEEWQESTKGDQGIPGKNLQILGTVADFAELDTKPKEDQAAYVLRDTSHLWVYVEADTAWKDLGKFNGKDGENGDPGEDGRNVVIKGAVATQSALPASPADQDAWAVQDTSTVWMWIVDAWVNLGRFQGIDGTPGVSLILKGAVNTVGDLPADPEEQDIWAVRADNSIYGYINAAWVRLGEFKGEPGIQGDPGLNAVAYWLTLPENDGKTEADYWTAQKGADGEDGKNLQIKGSVADDAALQAIPSPQDQDAYVVNTTHRLWVWSTSGGGWKDLGPFKGTDGKSAYQNWLDLGNSGTEADFNTSLKGADGQSIYLRGVVATFADLPANPQDQWVYSVQDENALYGYVGSSWLKMGSFKGVDGKDGKSLDIIKILTEEDQTIPPATDITKGKAYVDLDKFVWVNIENVWQNAGKFQGQQGDIGKNGTPLKLRGVVENLAALPPVGTGDGFAEEGDAWQTLDDKQVYVVVDGQYNGPFDFVGPDGGKGVQGDPGATVAIKDTFADMAALRAAHPTGTQTDAYMLENGHLVIWAPSITDWKDVGEFRGPEGKEGPQGEGIPGKPGLKGDQGSRWLTLPAGMDAPSDTFSGRVGDWAISATFNVFYKTANEGWVLWGRLVAGDVNSPLLSLGKVVRLGGNWVAAAIQDDVPDDGEPYLRTRAEGEAEGSWLKYQAPTIITLGGVPAEELGVSVATLVNGFVPASQLPSYVDDVLEFANQAAFPATGETGKIYISLATNVQYRWSGSAYIQLVASPGTTDAVVEGSTNLYFTQTRVRTTTLTNLSLATNSAIVAADTVISAFGKIQAQINAFVPGFADVPTDTNLYLRKGDKTWVVYTPPSPGISGPAGGNDNKTYVYKNNSWVEFNTYDLALTTMTATGTVDALTTQFVVVTNTTATAKTITLSDGPKAPARGKVLVFKINGATGAITFAPTGATALVWNAGSPPSLTGSRTFITFTWDGVEWVGAAGAVVP